MKLEQLIKNLTINNIKNKQSNLEIKDIAYDSRSVKKNGLFVAIIGYVTDGHFYIEKAIESGAIVIVHEKELNDYNNEIMYVQVVDSRRALGTISSAFYNNPSENMMVTGITGTNGKTTLTYMLKHIFTIAQKKSGLIGTIHNLIDDQVIDNKGRTTPESLEIQKIIKKMKDSSCTHLFMEVSSHALALERVNGVKFDYGIFTNLTQDHLDYHKNFENYFDAKSKLFYQLEKAAIINGDDPWGEALLEILKENDILTISYGLGSHNDYFARKIKMSVTGSDFVLVTPKGEEDFFINLPGEFMIYNAIGAIINAIEEGIPIAIIKKATASFSGVEGRMEILESNAPFDVIIDYAHSPDSLEKLLQSLRRIFIGRIILVFGCNGDRDKEKRPIMGRIAGELADFVIVTSDNPASEEPLEIINAVTEGVREKTDNYAIEEIRQEGIYHGARLCSPGDVLVLAGKGHEKQEVLKDKTLYYNEWDVAEEALKKLGFKINKNR